MPDGERGSGLGDRSHGGGLRNPRTLDPDEETYKPIATGPDAANHRGECDDEAEGQQKGQR